MQDARALLEVNLADGSSATLCGSHDLMMRRSTVCPQTVSELKMMFGDRRETHRRGRAEVDELAASLSAAFSGDRRTLDRRA